MKKKYDLYISLGAACSTSMVLRRSNLQFWSYPFDWLSGSNLYDRVKIFLNDFEGWLNKEDLEFLKEFNGPIPRNFYKNTKTNITYLHDFKYKTPLDECYDEVIEKYNRRINRLFNQIRGSKSVCFVYIDTPASETAVSDETLKELRQMLSDKFPDVNVDILYLFNTFNVSYKSRTTTNIDEHITKIKFDYNKYNPENSGDNDIKLLCRLFEDYHITFKYVTFKNRFRFLTEWFNKKFRKIYNKQIRYTGNKEWNEITILGFEFLREKKKSNF